MFDEFSYLAYMLIFTLTPISILWFRYYQFLWLNRKIIFYTLAFGIVYQLIADPFAEGWRAWFFSDDKVLGLWVLNFPIENVIFVVLISIAISSAVLVLVRHFNKKVRSHTSTSQ